MPENNVKENITMGFNVIPTSVFVYLNHANFKASTSKLDNHGKAKR